MPLKVSSHYANTSSGNIKHVMISFKKPLAEVLNALNSSIRTIACSGVQIVVERCGKENKYIWKIVKQILPL